MGHKKIFSLICDLFGLDDKIKKLQNVKEICYLGPNIVSRPQIFCFGCPIQFRSNVLNMDDKTGQARWVGSYFYPFIALSSSFLFYFFIFTNGFQMS
jgi:hypothetical protein